MATITTGILLLQVMVNPAGWHLPTGGNASAEFGVLDVAMGGTGASQSGNAGTAMSKVYRSYPNNFVYSGGVHDASDGSRSSGGYYWSSSAGSSSRAYGLVFGSSYVYPGTSNVNKYYGRSIRCLSGT